MHTYSKENSLKKRTLHFSSFYTWVNFSAKRNLCTISINYYSSLYMFTILYRYNLYSYSTTRNSFPPHVGPYFMILEYAPIYMCKIPQMLTLNIIICFFPSCHWNLHLYSYLWLGYLEILISSYFRCFLNITSDNQPKYTKAVSGFFKTF